MIADFWSGVLPCHGTVPIYGQGIRSRWRRLRRRPVDRVLCGLLWRHDGACVPFIPGYYVRAPLAHPLDLLWLHGRPGPWRCPDGCRAYGIDTTGPVHDFDYDGGVPVLHDVAIEWQFTPCEHKFRQVIGPEATDE